MRATIAVSGFIVVCAGSNARAAEPPDATKAAPEAEVAHPESEERSKTLEPKPAEKPAERERFVVDPYSDGAVIVISAAFLGLSQMIISSGELRPQQPVDKDKLSSIDRWAVKSSYDNNAYLYSNIGLFAAIGYAVADPIVSGASQGSWQTFLVDAVMYLESAAITGALTNLSKLAIRRPRPRAYAEQEELRRTDPNADISETDSALSFVSGHASTVAALSATATHLAFARAKRGSVRPWLTLIGGLLVTGFVSVERVRAGAHFPTDVLAGALIGAGVGVLVPHLHDDEKLTQRHVWIGFEMPRGGAMANLTIAL